MGDNEDGASALDGLLALVTACRREKEVLESEGESPHTPHKPARKKRRVAKTTRSPPDSPLSPIRPVQGKTTRLPLRAEDKWRDGDKICIKCSAFFPSTAPGTCNNHNLPPNKAPQLHTLCRVFNRSFAKASKKRGGDHGGPSPTRPAPRSHDPLVPRMSSETGGVAKVASGCDGAALSTPLTDNSTPRL